MKKWRITALVALVSFTLVALRPAQAFAYNEPTHRNIADWAYRIMVRVFEDSGAPVANRVLSVPPCQQNPCLQQWNDFIAAAGLAPIRMGILPVTNPALSKKIPVGSMGFAPELNSGFGAVDPSYSALYPPGSALSDGQLHLTGSDTLANLLKFTGAWVGYEAAAADWEFDDWHTSIDIGHLIFYGAGWLLSFGNADAGRQMAEAGSWIDRHVREGGSWLLMFCLVLLTFPALVFMSDEDRQKLIDEEQKIATFISNFDKTALGWIRPEDLGIVSSGVLVGLGHFINTQPQSGGIPSREFDDREGLLRAESYWIANPDPGGNRLKMMDSFDHYLLDVQALAAYIDPVASKGVDNYQALSPDDSHQPSRSRGNQAFSDGGYWKNHTLDITTFTPLDNLAYYGWTQWRDDPCKDISKLERPLHALQDATVPMHVIGCSGFGHRPYEDSVAKNVGLWQRIRHVDFSDPSAPDPSRDAVTQQAELQQIRSILLQAFELRQQIVASRPPGSKDIPIRDLVTTVAQRTQDRLRATTANISCEVGACTKIESDDPNDSFKKGNRRIQCNPSKCSGFDDLQSLCHGWKSLSNPDDPPDCFASAYVALALSDLQFAGRPIPALLGPGLSEIYNDNDEATAMSFYTARPQAKQDFRFVDEQRPFLELATAANIAFLASAGEFIPDNELPTSCYGP